VRSALRADAPLREVIFCCFSRQDLAIYETVLQEALPDGDTG